METIKNLSDLDLTKSYTLQDYFHWQFDEMVELIKGKIYKMSPAPRAVHQAVVGNLYYYLRQISNNCSIYNAPFDVYLQGSDLEQVTVVQPDITIVCHRNKIQQKGCIGAPDLVIEIASPASIKKDFDEKYHLYEESGVKEYWIVVIEQKLVLTYFLEEGNQKYTHTGTFTEEADIPISIWPEKTLKWSNVFFDI